MNIRNPWDDLRMTEKEFLNWLRSNTRRIWSRHPTKNAYKASKVFKAPLGKKTKKNPEGMVNAYKCEICQGNFRANDTEVDHLIAGGSFSTWEEYTEWARRILWVSFDELRVLCKTGCHAAVTYAQRHNMTFKEARATKLAIEATKKSVKFQKDQLTSLGYPSNMTNNATNRRACYVDYYNKQEE